METGQTLAGYCRRTQMPVAGKKAAPWPFSGGWFAYLSYDLASAKRSGEPLGLLAKVPAALLRKGREVFFVAEPQAASLQKTVLQDLRQGALAPSPRPALRALVEEDPGVFLGAVGRVQQAIAAGETYQVNLARQWRGEFSASASPYPFFQMLNVVNPAPFSALVTLPDLPFAILSASPERLVRTANGAIEARPIAGTRARTPGCETRTRQTLVAHPKERSEHIMLVDLARNDLARVSQPGSVRVPDLLDVTTYAHVHHLESTVPGKLLDGMTAGGVLEALFPGGTITGCPKTHTMALIDRMESTPRGAYTGSVGYISQDGQMDFNILIRTMVLQGQHLTFKTGAGIVADSNPVRELEETRAKAKGLLLAIGQP
jgi:anthranilate synthase component 1